VTSASALTQWVGYLDQLENLALRLESLVVDGGDLTDAAVLVAGAPRLPDPSPPADLDARRARVQRVAERALSVLERQRDLLRDDIAAVPLHAQGRTVGTGNDTLGGALDLQG
jgi:hypothetical protein